MIGAFIGGMFIGFILSFFCFCLGVAAGRGDNNDR